MRIGVICPKWGFTFINPVLNELKNHHVEIITEPFTKVRLAELMSKVDIVFVEWVGYHLKEVCELPKIKPIVVRGHFSDLNGSSVNSINWKKVNLMIFTNKFLMDDFFKRHPQIKVKSRVIRLGVDLDFFTLRPAIYDHAIGFVGFIKPIKDPIPVIDMVGNMNGWRLLMKATPSYDKTLLNAFSSRIVKYNNILWIKDWINNKDMVQFYHNIDVLVSNSREEGQGVAILESMACGVYALIRNWEHASELYPKELLFNTIEECRDKILEWDSKSDSEKREISIKMREFVSKHHDGKRYVKEMIEAIESVK